MAIKKAKGGKPASKKTAGKSPIRVTDGASYMAFRDDTTYGDGNVYGSSIPVSDLEPWCSSLRREDDPQTGYQRGLDMKRVEAITACVNAGTPVPTLVVLSAQRGAHLEYNRGGKSISFRRISESFAVIDAQHRLAGIARSNSPGRVMVQIYTGLSRAEEARLFIDINHLQKGVPPALLADVRALAQIESENDGKLRVLYDRLASDVRSPLLGHMAAAGGVPGKLTRVTFNTAFRRTMTNPQTNMGALLSSDPAAAGKALVGYLRAWSDSLGSPGELVKPAMFGTAAAVMEDVMVAAQRVAGRPTEGAMREVVAANLGAIAPVEGTRRTKAGMTESLRVALRGRVGLAAVETPDDDASEEEAAAE